MSTKIAQKNPYNGEKRPAPPPAPPKISCECIFWARDGNQFGTNHHKKCGHYPSELEEKTKQILSLILKHFRDYCNEGDGIPPEAWEDYKRALLFVGDFDRFLKCLEWEKKNPLEVNTL